MLVDQAESPLAWLATRKGRDGRALVDAAMLQAGAAVSDPFPATLTETQVQPLGKVMLRRELSSLPPEWTAETLTVIWLLAATVTSGVAVMVGVAHAA